MRLTVENKIVRFPLLEAHSSKAWATLIDDTFEAAKLTKSIEGIPLESTRISPKGDSPLIILGPVGAQFRPSKLFPSNEYAGCRIDFGPIISGLPKTNDVQIAKVIWRLSLVTTGPNLAWIINNQTNSRLTSTSLAHLIVQKLINYWSEYRSASAEFAFTTP